MKARVLSQEEFDDVAGVPAPMTPEQVMDLLKGHRFRFSLGTSDGPQIKDYLIEARKISEKILRRSVVNLEKGLATIQDHLALVNEP